MVEANQGHIVVNYNYKFIDGCSRRATSLVEFGLSYVWLDKCQKVFDYLKATIISEQVLSLLDHEKPLEGYTNASDYVIRGVLLQDQCPIASESKKLNEVDKKYPAHVRR